jgi:hypothetical protein
MKIDTEGAEGLVLAGAQRILEQYRPLIFLEFSCYAQKNMGSDPERTLAILERYEYQLSYIDDTKRRIVPMNRENILHCCETEATINLLCKYGIHA